MNLPAVCARPPWNEDEEEKKEYVLCSQAQDGVLAVKLDYSDLCARMTVRGSPSRSCSLALPVPVSASVFPHAGL